MAALRFMCSGRINKPLPAALVSALPAIKDAVVDLQSYARKINEGKNNEEATVNAIWGNETGYIWWNLDLAIPMPLPQVLQDKLPAIKTKIRQLKTHAVSTGEDAFRAQYHICKHGEGGGDCSLTMQEI